MRDILNGIILFDAVWSSIRTTIKLRLVIVLCPQNCQASLTNAYKCNSLSISASSPLKLVVTQQTMLI